MRNDDWTANGAATLEQPVRRPADALVVIAEAVGVQSFIAHHELEIAMIVVGATFGGLRDDTLGQTDIRCEVVGYNANFFKRVGIRKHSSLMPSGALDRDTIQRHIVAAELSTIDTHARHVSPVAISNAQIRAGKLLWRANDTGLQRRIVQGVAVDVGEILN